MLEAPFFREPDLDSKVVQYKRKGDIITIHPSVGNTDKFNHLSPEQKKLNIVRRKLKKTPEWNEDPMFKGDIDDVFSLQDDFIAVLDRQGKRAYVMKEHIYVYFNDTREFVSYWPLLDEHIGVETLLLGPSLIPESERSMAQWKAAINQRRAIPKSEIAEPA